MSGPGGRGGGRPCGRALGVLRADPGAVCGAPSLGSSGRPWVARGRLAAARRGGVATTGWRRCSGTTPARAPGSSCTTASTTSPSSSTSTQVVKRSSGNKLGEMLLRTLKMLATPQMQGRCQNHLLLGSYIRMIERSFRNQQNLLLPLCSLIPVHGPTG